MFVSLPVLHHVRSFFRCNSSSCSSSFPAESTQRRWHPIKKSLLTSSSSSSSSPPSATWQSASAAGGGQSVVYETPRPRTGSMERKRTMTTKRRGEYRHRLRMRTLYTLQQTINSPPDRQTVLPSQQALVHWRTSDAIAAWWQRCDVKLDPHEMGLKSCYDWLWL